MSSVPSSPAAGDQRPPSDEPPKLPGYQVTGVLGQGGMGRVYEAEQTSLGRKVAIKAFAAQGPSSLEFYSRFLDEARAMAQAEGHDSIARVHDLVQDGTGNHYIVMERLEGKTLQEKLAATGGRPLDPAQATVWMAEAASAVEHIHQRGFIHRDIKPGNLMITSSGALKLMDFGIARLTDPDRECRTQTGFAFGTPEYMSPEQIRGSKMLDERTDVYSLCATLYQLVTGQLPFEGSGYDLLRHIVETHPPSPRKLNPSLPRGLEKVILKGMSKKPENRYASAGELAAALRRVQGKAPVMSDARIVRSETPPGGAKSPMVLAGGILALLAALVAGALLLFRGEAAKPDPASSLAGGGKPALAAATPEVDAYAEIEKLFERGSLPNIEARLAKADPEDSRFDDFRAAVQAGNLATELFDADRFNEARDALQKVPPKLATSNFVIRLLENIDWEITTQTDLAWKKAKEAFEKGEYAEAQAQAARADSLKKNGHADARRLVEIASLAALAAEAVPVAESALKERRWSEALASAQLALDALRDGGMARSNEKIAAFEEKLGDIAGHAQLEASYFEGRADEALEGYQKISQPYREANRLDKRAALARSVGELARRAEEEKSVELARQVMDLERDENNAYHQRMKTLADSLQGSRRNEAMAVMVQGDPLFREKKYDKALALYFQARQIDPSFKEAEQRHRDTAQKIIEFAKGIYPYQRGAQEKKHQLLSLVKRYSLDTDGVYREASNQLNELATQSFNEP